MATFEVDPNKINELVAALVHTIGSRRVHMTDVCIALSETTGRIIAAQDINPLAMQEMHQACSEHIERTIRIGCANKGLNLGDQ